MTVVYTSFINLQALLKQKKVVKAQQTKERYTSL